MSLNLWSRSCKVSSFKLFSVLSSEDKIKLFTSLQYLGKDLQKISRLPRSVWGYFGILGNLAYKTLVDSIVHSMAGY